MKKLVCIAMLTVSLVACSKKDANNSNFQEAIQKGFDEGRANHSAGMCLSINTNGSMRLGIIFDEDSQKISIGDGSSDVVTQERIDTLTDAGLIDPESNDGHTFKVSEMGKPFLRNVLDNRYPAFVQVDTPSRLNHSASQSTMANARIQRLPTLRRSVIKLRGPIIKKFKKLCRLW